MRGSNWIELLSKPAVDSNVVKRSPFAPKQENAGGGRQAAQAEPAGQPQQQQQQPEPMVVPILLSKAAVQQIPEAKVEQCKEPQQQLQKLQELQQQTSSLLAAIAELAKEGQPKEQQLHEGTHVAGTARLPVMPPEHDEMEGCYYWTGSRTSAAYSEPQHAASAASAGDGRAGQQQQQQQQRDSSMGGGAAGTGSMETSATTRVLQSTGHSALFSTARSPAQEWGSALSRIRQLQQQTVAALSCQQEEEQAEGC